jgi:hypothetical protein
MQIYFNPNSLVIVWLGLIKGKAALGAYKAFNIKALLNRIGQCADAVNFNTDNVTCF